MSNDTLDPEIDDITDNTPDDVTPESKPTAQPDSSDELRKAMADLAGTVKTLATPKETPTQKSPEDLAKEWGVYNPEESRKDFFNKFFRLNPDASADEIKEAKELFADMQKGLVKQAILGALKVIRENDLKSFREEFDPVREHVSSAKAEKTREKFFSTYPSLRDSDGEGPKFSKVIDATARTLADKEFESEAAYFKALAEGAAETIKGVFPSFDLGAVQQTKTKPAGTSPSLPRTRAGGTGGTGAGGGSGTTKKSDDDSDTIDWTH